MPAPAERILAEAMAARLGIVPHALTAPAQPARGLGTRLPQRLEDMQRVVGAKLRHRLVADGRTIIKAGRFGFATLVQWHFAQQRHVPLGPVLGVSPSQRHAVDQFASRGAKRHLSRRRG